MLLLLCSLAFLVSGALLSAKLFPEPSDQAPDRACATFVGAVGLPTLLVAVLGSARWLTRTGVELGTFAVVVATVVTSSPKSRRLVSQDANRLLRNVRAALFQDTWAFPAWAGVATLGFAVWASWLLPPWSWDSLGYHLPIVYDALQTHSLREIPTHGQYINVYPKAVEYYFIFFRTLLRDDRLIDVAQLPFAIGLVAVTASLSSLAGARPPRAIAIGLAVLTIPAISLQLQTNYVDVAFASFLLSALYFASSDLRLVTAVMTGLSLALFLASKPSAPSAALLVGVAYTARCAWMKRLDLAGAAAATSTLGVYRYVYNAAHFGNPVWPVEMRIGPFTLPGLDPMSYFFNAYIEEPYRSMGWSGRVISSWFAWPKQYLYDMRIGGFGPLFQFWLAPLALLGILTLRRQSKGLFVVAGVGIAATLANPGAFWPRYTLALPALLAPLATVSSERLRPFVRRIVDGLAGAVAVWGLCLAYPGWTGYGPTLWSTTKMPADHRVGVVGVDKNEPDWERARALVEPGEAMAYDHSFQLPGQMWVSDGRARVVYIPDTVRTTESMYFTLNSERVRVVALDNAKKPWLPAGHLRTLFGCPYDDCTVYEVR